MLSNITHLDSDTCATLAPFSWSRYLEYLEDDKFSPADRFSFDHLTPQELNSLSDKMESFSAELLEESHNIQNDDLPRTIKNLGNHAATCPIVNEALGAFELAAEQLASYATSLSNDAAEVRLQILKREWNLVTRRVQSVKRLFLEDELHGRAQPAASD